MLAKRQQFADLWLRHPLLLLNQRLRVSFSLSNSILSRLVWPQCELRGRGGTDAVASLVVLVCTELYSSTATKQKDTGPSAGYTYDQITGPPPHAAWRWRWSHGRSAAQRAERSLSASSTTHSTRSRHSTCGSASAAAPAPVQTKSTTHIRQRRVIAMAQDGMDDARHSRSTIQHDTLQMPTCVVGGSNLRQLQSGQPRSP